MQLTDEMNHFILRRPVVPELRVGRFPNLMDRPFSVHETDHHMGGGRKAMKSIGREIVQHVPDLAAVLMALKTYVATETRPESFDSIPRCAEEIVRHLMATRPRVSGGPN